jgi:glutaminyl-tRNA synthetase
VVRCIGYDEASETVRCTYYEDSRSGTSGAERYKVKGNIHWASVKHAYAAQVRLYDRLFKVPNPAGVEHLNPESGKAIAARLEPSLREDATQPLQFERHGYFIRDSAHGGFNRTVGLRDSRR